jgi:hypothetical protein
MAVSANYDLEAAIRHLLDTTAIHVKWEWVRGHLSRRKKRQDFTWPEQLNDSADSLATRARSDHTAADSSH